MSEKIPAAAREGSLEAPTRHPIAWKEPEYLNRDSLFKELDRVFDICHGCRRCFSLCNSFPTLFDAIDESATGELDGVDKKVYWDVVDHCYLCDMCYMSKCPYVPPHPWNVDFPHLMLRAKAYKFNDKESDKPVRARDKILSATDLVGNLAGIPVVAEIVNAVSRVTAIMDGIASATAEQRTGIEEVNRAVAQMDQMTQQNAALVEQASAAAASLEDQAGALHHAVSAFRLAA